MMIMMQEKRETGAITMAVTVDMVEVVVTEEALIMRIEGNHQDIPPLKLALMS